MTDLLAALILLGTPAAALFAIRCAIRRQFRRELDTDPAFAVELPTQPIRS